MNNRLKFFLIVSILTIIPLFIVNLIAGSIAFIIFLIFYLIALFLVIINLNKIILYLYKATLYDNNFQINEIIENLSKKANINKPKLYLIDIKEANSFALARSMNKSCIVLSKNLIDILNREELEAVIAHELTHIKNKDTLISAFIAVIATFVVYLTRINKFYNNENNNFFYTIVCLVFIPLLALLIKLSISKSREFIADFGSKTLLGDGLALSNALIKINNFNLRSTNSNIRFETIHMFIDNPYKNKDFIDLFNTHPSVKARVDKILYSN